MVNTMERGEPKGVGGNELGSHTAPVATTNNGDFGFIIGEVGIVLWGGGGGGLFLYWLRLWRWCSSLGFKCWSHEARERCECECEWWVALETRGRETEMETKTCSRKREYKRKRAAHLGGDAIAMHTTFVTNYDPCITVKNLWRSLLCFLMFMQIWLCVYVASEGGAIGNHKKTSFVGLTYS